MDQSMVERSILVTVLDKDGAPLRDLKPGEFIVRQDGQKREVTTAILATDPLSVALLVDTSKPNMGTEFPVRDVRAGLSALVKTVAADNPQSQISLMDYAGAAVKTVDYTSNGDQMLKSINRLIVNQRSYGVIVEGLLDTGKDLQKAKNARRAVVIVGFDSPDSSGTQPRDAAMAVQKSGAAVWAIAVGNNSSPVRDVLFENLPPLTGGMRITMQTATGLAPALERIGAALTSQYVVTFKCPEGSAASEIQAGASRGDKVLRGSLVR
jgi:hypothetical protein